MSMVLCSQCGKEFDADEKGAMPRARLLSEDQKTSIPVPLCAHCVAYNPDGTEKVWLA